MTKKPLSGTTVSIGSRKPIRTTLSSLPNYFVDHASAFDAIDKVLATDNLMLCPNRVIDLSSQSDRVKGEGASGSILMDIVQLDDKINIVASGIEVEKPVYTTCVSYSWYYMQSGRVEITVYLT